MGKHLSFRISWLAQIPAGAIGVILAYKDFGVWALVAQQLIRDILSTDFLWYFVKWRPQCLFDFSRLKKLLSFSWKLLCSSILSTLYQNIYTLIVGKLFSLDTLSFYRKGRHLPALGMHLINNTVGGVLFPAFTKIQDDKPKMHELARRGLKNIMFLVVPAMGIFFVIAHPLIIILYTDKWLPSAIFLQICCFSFVLAPFHTMNLQIMTACGRSDYFLYIEIFKKIELLLLVFLTYRFGIIVMTCAVAANSYLMVIINGWPNRKLIDYPPWSQFMDVLPFFLLAIAAAGATQITRLLPQNNWLLLFTNAAVFTAVYLGLAALMRQIPADLYTLAKQLKNKIRQVARRA